MSLPFVNLRRFQVCKARDSFCKLAFFANLPRPHDTGISRTDISCPRSRKKNVRSRAGNVASSEKSRFAWEILARICKNFPPAAPLLGGPFFADQI
jgi:hypothetical protein